MRATVDSNGTTGKRPPALRPPRAPGAKPPFRWGGRQGRPTPTSCTAARDVLLHETAGACAAPEAASPPPRIPAPTPATRTGLPRPWKRRSGHPGPGRGGRDRTALFPCRAGRSAPTPRRRGTDTARCAKQPRARPGGPPGTGQSPAHDAATAAAEQAAEQAAEVGDTGPRPPRRTGPPAQLRHRRASGGSTGCCGPRPTPGTQRTSHAPHPHPHPARPEAGAGPPRQGHGHPARPFGTDRRDTMSPPGAGHARTRPPRGRPNRRGAKPARAGPAACVRAGMPGQAPAPAAWCPSGTRTATTGAAAGVTPGRRRC
jgi:hypothetical protein